MHDNIKLKKRNDAKISHSLVSVIMPVYNTPTELLTVAVKSVMLQTYKEIELIIIDDGSEKLCADVCDKLAAGNDRIRVLHNANLGVSVVRNLGLNESKGEYIAFIDSDDTMVLNALQVMVEQIEGVDFVVCGCNRVYHDVIEEKAQVNNAVVIDNIKCIDYLCYMNSPYSHIETNAIWGKLFRRELINNLRCDEKMVMGEDFKFNFDYIMKSKKGKYLDFCGYNYLERDGSLSRKYNDKMIRSIDVLDKMILEYEDTVVYDALISRSVNIAFTILMLLPDNMREEKKRIQHFINKFRGKVLRNPKTKRKVRIACLTSYFGYKTTKKIFEISRKS